jgi:hypothetical protein
MEAYEEGRQIFAELALDPTFRDFVILYLTEGYKRNRNNVGVANSDPALIRLAARWINHLTRNAVAYSIHTTRNRISASCVASGMRSLTPIQPRSVSSASPTATALRGGHGGHATAF